MSWFLRAGVKPVGPFQEEEIRARILAGEVSPEDLVWKDGSPDWMAAHLWPEFRSMHWPAWQEAGMVDEDAGEWIVLQITPEGPRTTGPWSLREIRQALREKRLRPEDHLWKKGLTAWARISSRPENLTADGPETPSPL
ncbi:MAG: DUF4339 domain-containing protein [Bdellovibrionaceae bacterium]|nr:DUF4339 domain-containing protein [Pseudobdellovibrionaceae bacterium]MBX3034862.1 DUF4339 domain-containing protein [Pseudobdellovibrionaceae bacterium]